MDRLPIVRGLCLALLVAFASGASKLQERYSWKQLDFVFPNRALRERAIASGDYIPTNGLPVGIERFQNKLFVSVPRWRNGIPSTLNYIDLDQTPTGSPPLIPYPSFENNIAGDCANGLSTVYRIKADKCGRLWVLDTGTVGIGNTTENVCPYALNVFDLATDRRIRRYELRAEDTNPNTFIANIAIDIGKNCEDTFAYMSDELGYGLISYSWEQNKSWRFAHSFFFPDPLRGDYNVAGLNFQWGEEGIFGIALSPIGKDGYRTLFFSPLASHREFSVSTRTLRDSTRLEESFHDFTFLEERAGNAHTTSRVMNDDGLMLFNLIDQNAVGCWHSSLPYLPKFHDIVDRDDVGLVFPADVKIDDTNTVWVISDRMPVFLIAELDYNDVNFRIYSAPLDVLIDNTVCNVDSRSPNRFGSDLTTLQYVELTTDKLSNGYNSPSSSIKIVPSSQVYSTQEYSTITAPTKAYNYNQHNGLAHYTQSPASKPSFVEHGYFGPHYQPNNNYRGDWNKPWQRQLY